MTDLRTRQREGTRSQIIDAVHALLAEEHPATLSMPRVAERAGVSLRTLYRYFPSKEALVDAASETFRVPDDAIGGPVELGNLAHYLRLAWAGFDESVGAVRAQHTTPAGREVRDRRVEGNRAVVRAGLARAGADLTEVDTDALVDLVLTLTSSATYLELVDRLGWTSERAASVVAWATRAIVERAVSEGGLST